MNDLQQLLTEIQRLSNEATPAPWAARKLDLEGADIAHTYYDDELGIDVNVHVVSTEDSMPADAEFIALARTALPQLASILQAVIYDCESIIEAIDQKKIAHPARRGIKVQAGTTLQVIEENLGGNECELNH